MAQPPMKNKAVLNSDQKYSPVYKCNLFFFDGHEFLESG